MMTAMLEPIEWFGSWLLENSWQAAILAILIFTVQFIFRRWLTPFWRHALWLLLIVKLLIPFNLESNFSVFNIAAPDYLFPKVHSGKEVHSGVSAEDIFKKPVPKISIQTLQSRGFRWTPLRVFLLIWLLVCLGLFGRILYLNNRLLSITRKTRPLIDKDILDLLEDCKPRLRIFMPINVVITNQIATPAMLGFIRPRLLIPEPMINAFSREELRCIFLHELAHIKRMDIITSWLMTFLQVLHWFNPLIWLAFRRMRADMEIACDAAALSAAETPQYQNYGETIIKVLSLASAPQAVPGMAAILEDKQDLQRRIKLIGNPFQYKRHHTLTGWLLLLLLGCTAFTDASIAMHPEKILEKFKTAYDQRNLRELMSLYAENAVYRELNESGEPINKLTKMDVSGIYRYSFLDNPQFNYYDVQVRNDTVLFTGAFRNSLFEIIGMHELKGRGTFVLENGKIISATWQENIALRNRRVAIFDTFLNWLKTDRPETYKEMFGNDLFIHHRAKGDAVNELFLEWIASRIGGQ